MFVKSTVVTGDRKEVGRADSQTPLQEGTRGFALLLSLVFLGLGSLSIFHHEMWRDELQAWMIAKDSFTMSDLFQNLRYDGHPSLWYLPLYVITRFTAQPYAMQILHILLAFGAVYVFARYSPFPRWQKVLFVFGYLPFYEYAVISRNYAIGILLIFGYCALFPMRRKRLLLLSVVLALLSNASAYAFMIAAGLAFTLLVAWYADKRSGTPWDIARWKVALSVAIIVVGLGLSAWTMKPKPDHGLYRDWHTKITVGEVALAVSTVAVGHTLVPDMFYQWTVTPKGLTILGLQAILGALLIAYSVCLFARKPVSLFAYIATTGPILLFDYVKFAGSVRHHGHYFIIFIVCLWLSAYYKERQLKWPVADRVTSACARSARLIVPALLMVQLACGIAATARDLARPFSMSKATADFIRANHMTDMLIIADRDSPVSPVVGYINRRVYYPTQRRFGTFVTYNQTRIEIFGKPEFFEDTSRLVSQQKRDALFILHYPLTASECRAHGIRFVKSFGGSIINYESYWLYIAKYGGGRS